MSVAARLAISSIVVLALTAIVTVAGVSGFLFRIWPTSWPDQPIDVTSAALTRLTELAAEPKFKPDASMDYPGVGNDMIRARGQRIVDELIARLETTLPLNPRKSEVLVAFKGALADANEFDTEDQERLARYLEQILGILDLGSSNELITVWRTGFPYGWVLRGPHT